MARYKAIIKGESPVGCWREPGDVFETDAPQGKWMELLDPLDHDGDGVKGGSKVGSQSTRRKGVSSASAKD